jgi:hypothetical protein
MGRTDVLEGAARLDLGGGCGGNILTPPWLGLSGPCWAGGFFFFFWFNFFWLEFILNE